MDGTHWHDHVSGNGEDWGYDVGWSWTTDHGNPAYCRRVGDGGNAAAQSRLDCSVLDGTHWHDHVSGNGEDWGYDVGWSWTTDHGSNPAYCRRVDDGGNAAAQSRLECSVLDGTHWHDHVSGNGEDWGMTSAGPGWGRQIHSLSSCEHCRTHASTAGGGSSSPLPAGHANTVGRPKAHACRMDSA